MRKCEQCNGTGIRTTNQIPKLTADFDLVEFCKNTDPDELREIVIQAERNLSLGSKRWSDRVFAALSIY